MPDKKNRNSREDKSLKNNRFQSNSKTERPENLNSDRKKKFEGNSKRPYKSRADKPENDSTERRNPRSAEDRPFNKKPFGGSKEKPFGKADRSFEKKSTYSEKSNRGDKKPLEDHPFERRPRTAEGKKFDKPREEKSFERRPSRSGEDRRFSKPEGERSFERRPFKEGDKPSPRPGTGLPYERKPFKSKNETRKWTSEERIEQPGTRGRKKTTTPSNDDLIRLNRYIANAGICSRRKADELIEAGVISVNGEVVSELGYKVNPVKDIIRYNGETLKREKMTYVLLNKPKDYITTTDDPQERKTVMELVDKASRERIYPVGRLDRNTTGLLLMTNDGDLAEKLSHPRNNITKIYQVELNKSLSQGDFNKIEYGLELEDGFIKPDALSYVQGATKKEIGIQIHTGKNRIVRRIFEFLGYEVVKLDRVVYGSLTKKDLPRGRWRYLEEKEIIQLKHLIK